MPRRQPAFSKQSFQVERVHAMPEHSHIITPSRAVDTFASLWSSPGSKDNCIVLYDTAGRPFCGHVVGLKNEGGEGSLLVELFMKNRGRVTIWQKISDSEDLQTQYGRE